jgi:hypothetical protein
MAGPAVHRLARRSSHAYSAVDGFTVAAVGGLVVLHLAPQALVHGGLFAALLLAIGAALPMLLHRMPAARAAEHVVLTAGLAAHAAMESAALAAIPEDEALGLGLAIAVHRLPVGLLIYGAVRRETSVAGGLAAVGALVVATVAGFGAGHATSELLPEMQFAWLKALVAGSLIHVAVAGVHEHIGDSGHDHDHHHHPAEEKAAGIGALLGAAVVFAALQRGGHAHDGGSAVEALLGGAQALSFGIVGAAALVALRGAAALIYPMVAWVAAGLCLLALVAPWSGLVLHVETSWGGILKLVAVGGVVAYALMRKGPRGLIAYITLRGDTGSD